MANVLVNENSLMAIADAIREKENLPGERIENIVYQDVGELTLHSCTPNIDPETGVNTGSYPNSHTQTDVLTIPNAESIHVTIVCNKSDSGDKLCAWLGAHPDYSPVFDYGGSFTGLINGNVTKEYDIEGDSVTIGFYSDSSGQNYGYWATVTGVEREIVSQDIIPINRYQPAEMAPAILGIKDGSKEIHIGAYNSNWLYDMVDHLSDPDYTIYLHPCKYITSTSGMMYSPTSTNIIGMTLSALPSIKIKCTIKVDLNHFSDGSRCYPSQVYKSKFTLNFSQTRLTAIPTEIIDLFAENGGKITLEKGFYETQFVDIDFIEPLYNGWLEDTSILSANSTENANNMFYGCSSLKRVDCGKIPRTYWSQGSYRYQFVYNTFNNCYALQEALNIWPPDYNSSTLSTNAFSGTFTNCYMLGRVTFAPGRKVGTISNQVIDLSSKVGYGLAYSINSLPLVDDDETYAQYKDGEYKTNMKEYSHYNHDSAVETINSLPIVNSGTIKFDGASGSSTDGGAINTLTDEEIAVATEKGWTVSIV